MFLNSILSGLKVFTFWETIVVIIIYLIIILPTHVYGQNVNLMSDRGDFGKNITPLFQVLGVYTVVLILSPIILGFSDKAAWSLPFLLVINNPFKTILLLGTLFIISKVLESIPFLRFISGRFQFILGIIILGNKYWWQISINVIKNNKNFSDLHFKEIVLIPSFLYTIDFLVVSVILITFGAVIIGSMLYSMLYYEKKTDPKEFRDKYYYLCIIMEAILSFIPVYIYGAWLANQIKTLY
jgi:hypothetical protein